MNFSTNNMKKKKTGINGCSHDFSVDSRAFDASDIIGIDKYLMKKNDIK